LVLVSIVYYKKEQGIANQCPVLFYI